MGFLATTSPPAEADEPVIENDPWFPSVDLALLRKTARLDGTVTADRLHHAAVNAIASVNTELQGWQAAQVALGHVSLAGIPGATIGGESVQCIHYRRAVFSAVQSDLAEAYRDFDTTGAGDKRAEQLEAKIDEHRRNMRWAISDLLRIRRTTVELI